MSALQRMPKGGASDDSIPVPVMGIGVVEVHASKPLVE